MNFYVKNQNCTGAPGEAYLRGEIPTGCESPVEDNDDYRAISIKSSKETIRVYYKAGIHGPNDAYSFRCALSVLERAGYNVCANCGRVSQTVCQC